MPRYIIERSWTPLTRDELDVAGKRSVAVVDEMPGVVWIRSYVSDIEGKICCEYDAPDQEAVREHARRAGFPVDRISEVSSGDQSVDVSVVRSGGQAVRRSDDLTGVVILSGAKEPYSRMAPSLCSG